MIVFLSISHGNTSHASLESSSHSSASINFRGQCAQACRLPYGLIANGELKHLSFDGIEGIMGNPNGRAAGIAANDENVGYLLSPQDLCGLDQVEQLVRAGVSCLKIEGRLKDASYVAATTRA